MIIIRAGEAPSRERKSKTAQRREIERYQREQAKKRGAILRGLLKRLGIAKRRLLRITKADCDRLRAQVKRKRGLPKRIAAADAAAACATGRGRALVQYSARFRAVAEEILYLRETYLAVKRAEPRKPAAKRERKREAFDLETPNIPPELQPLWLKIGRGAQFAPTPHADRWERFLHFVHENPEEVYGAMYQAADTDAADWLANLEREQWEQGAA